MTVCSVSAVIIIVIVVVAVASCSSSVIIVVVGFRKPHVIYLMLQFRYVIVFFDYLLV